MSVQPYALSEDCFIHLLVQAADFENVMDYLSSEKPLVIIMAPNPKPCNHITVKNPQCSVSQRHANWPDYLFLIDTFEA